MSKCPNCSHNFKKVVLANKYSGKPMEVEQCQNCGGVWFGQHQMFQIDDWHLKNLEKIDEKKLLSPAHKIAGLACPDDGTPLAKYQNHTFIDRLNFQICPKCFGIWSNVYDVERFIKEKKARVPQKKSDDSELDDLRDYALNLIRFTNDNDIFGPLMAEYEEVSSRTRYKFDPKLIEMIKEIPPDARAETYNAVITERKDRDEAVIRDINNIGRVIRFVISMVRVFV